MATKRRGSVITFKGKAAQEFMEALISDKSAKQFGEMAREAPEPPQSSIPEADRQPLFKTDGKETECTAVHRKGHHEVYAYGSKAVCRACGAEGKLDL